MKSFLFTATNIQKPHSASSFVKNKQKLTFRIKLLRSSCTLISVIRNLITQILVRDSKKLLELEVLMNHTFLSINKQKIMIEKCWLESEKELDSSQERTKTVDQQVCYMITLVFF